MGERYFKRSSAKAEVGASGAKEGYIITYSIYRRRGFNPAQYGSEVPSPIVLALIMLLVKTGYNYPNRTPQAYAFGMLKERGRL